MYLGEERRALDYWEENLSWQHRYDFFLAFWRLLMLILLSRNTQKRPKPTANRRNMDRNMINLHWFPNRETSKMLWIQSKHTTKLLVLVFWWDLLMSRGHRTTSECATRRWWVFRETYMLTLAPMASIFSSTVLTFWALTTACPSPQWSSQPV